VSVVYRVIGGVSSIRTDEEAQKIGAYIEKTFGDGPIAPERVVDLAGRPRSPLHKHFEWDDSLASHKYRVHQARAILRSIAVIRTDTAGEERKTRAYHNVALLGQRGVERTYVSQRVVWSSPELADQIVVRAQRELLGWQDRYGLYEELRAAVGHVGQAIETLGERAE